MIERFTEQEAKALGKMVGAIWFAVVAAGRAIQSDQPDLGSISAISREVEKTTTKRLQEIKIG